MNKSEDTHFYREDARVLRPLVDRTLQLSLGREQKEKKTLWAEHQALRKTEKIPVAVHYDGIPKPQWEFMFGKDHLKTKSILAREIEFDLKRSLWMAENVPDDHIIWPSIIVPAVISQSVDWGVPLKWSGRNEDIDNPLEAKRIIPPFVGEINVGRLQLTDMIVNEVATYLRVQEATELVAGKLYVHVHYPNLGHSPFDLAVTMRGIQEIMYDVVDSPNRVHSLMDFITGAHQSHHRRREQKGWINCAPTGDCRYVRVGFRVQCAFPHRNFNPQIPRLCDEWAYISAQNSGSLSPKMYEEFVHPYNVRLSKHFVNQTVYYHGCECLDNKLNIIERLPNLRRFQVSPWSSVQAAKEKFEGKVILEVHAHPGKVFFGSTREDMRSDLKQLVSDSEGVPIDLNLSDIHSFNENPNLLTIWAEEAQKVAHKKR